MGTSGHAIFITGVPSAGKSTVCRELEQCTTSFSVISGDDLIRRMRPQSPEAIRECRARMFQEVRDVMVSSNAIVDASLPASYVEEAKAQFGSRGLFVALRLGESSRRAREAARARDVSVRWDLRMTELLGPEELYDLNLDSSASSPAELADAVLSKALEHWKDVAL